MMNKSTKTHLIILLGFTLFFMNSCKVFFPNLMFRTNKSEITGFTDSTTVEDKDPYVLNQGDRIEFQIFSNRGMKLIDFGFGQQAQQQQQNIEYVVQQNGYVILPLIDSIKIQGLTIKEATFKLENEYKKIINDPFVFLRIKNWRVLLFRGIGDGQVVQIQDRYTNLIQLLAQVGGIPAQTKSYNIKIIRGDLKEPMIWKVDLSSMKKIKKANIEIRANDIIYIEPVKNVPQALVNTVTPFLTLVNTYLLIRALGNANSGLQ